MVWGGSRRREWQTDVAAGSRLEFYPPCCYNIPLFMSANAFGFCKSRPSVALFVPIWSHASCVSTRRDRHIRAREATCSLQAHFRCRLLFFSFLFFSRATSGRRDQALQQQPSPRSAAAACFLSNYRCVTCTSGRLHVSTSLCLSWHILWSQQPRLQGTALPCPPSLGISISMLTGAPGERCAKGQHDNCQQPALISWGLFIKRLCWVWLH